jgi:hypothetical protein
LNTVDLYITYEFLRRLVAPFAEWEAFKLGVIDADGNILVNKKKRTQEQKNSFGKFDLLVLKLKKLLAKVPGGNTKLASWAAALLLIKEHDSLLNRVDVLTEDEILFKINKYIAVAEQHVSIDDRFELFEETSVAGSADAGEPFDLIKQSLSIGKKKKKKESK